eukprot:CAMPEP_0201682246 /NCGR_PEP_ID=MMETSP0494-20130426/51522_1 /ASSEMBLY_ACC=CAM_ASM_000839 /TAXON_ID=420259 /ORGANISM="Thalassiosira gravida, Strain GMp14c1" /LENGTH=540 /DNA_ID=CAMNT_0048166003 /DNA_START=330 /DNA_END=1953 /DNA_ORIENTATION=-
MHAAVFHLQNKHYDGARPPNFFDNDNLNKLNLTRARKRHGERTHSTHRRLKSVVDYEKEIIPEEGQRRNAFTPPSPHPLPNGVLDGFWDLVPPTPDEASANITKRTKLNSKYFPSSQFPNRNFACRPNNLTPPLFLQELAHLSSLACAVAQLNSKYFPSSQFPNRNFACRPNNLTPPLFLQELAHLSSLACAVALSTLRNDIEGSESPLDIYVPGSAWPPSDPDKLPWHIRRIFQHRFRVVTIVRHWLGIDRLPKYRSKYNAARPLLILGGVSDSEILFLQKARGPHAKAQMAMGWLQEFLIREHLDGSLGEVHSAIVSRLVQFLSDGMLAYNQARQIMYIPFPFPHAQLSAFFTCVMVVAVPFLMDQYTNVLHSVPVPARPTQRVLHVRDGRRRALPDGPVHQRAVDRVSHHLPDRDLPRGTARGGARTGESVQERAERDTAVHAAAVYNETLATMFSGYNPDSFWDAEVYQGALQAMALGKVYQRTSEVEDENATVEAIMQVATNNVSTTPGKDKNVTFATRIETKDSSPTCDYKLIT